jgi:hypothetical protein
MTVIDEIKSRLDILDVASRYLSLQRAGANWTANCPFHADKTPSLVVFPAGQRWKCFGAGCGLAGDVFDLVGRLQSWDFPETLRYLARLAGVELKPLSPEVQACQEQARRREEVFAVAQAFFQERLFRSPSPAGGRGDRGEGLEYALSRAWTADTIRDAGLGFFGRDWDSLRQALQSAAVDLASPPAVALIGYRGDVAAWAASHRLTPPRAWLDAGKVPAMPPDLLIYPHFQRGRVVYLAGRGVTGKSHWNPPASLAGPRQPYYNHFSWAPDLTSRRLVIVEGQGDAVALAQFSLPALALAGCSLAAGLPIPAKTHNLGGNSDGGYNPAFLEQESRARDSDSEGDTIFPSPTRGRGVRGEGHGGEGSGDDRALPSLNFGRGAVSSFAATGEGHGDEGEPPSPVYGRRVGDEGSFSSDNYLLSDLRRRFSAGARLYLGLDQDDAGRLAAEKAAQSLLSLGIPASRLFYLRWPASDANAWLQAGASPEDAEALLDSAPSWVKALADFAALEVIPEARDARTRALFSALAGLDPYDLARYRPSVTEALGLSRLTFDDLLRAARRDPSRSVPDQEHYLVQHGRVVYRSYDASGNEILDPLCNFNAWIDQDVLRDNGQEMEREFRLCGTIGKRPLPVARVRAAEFTQMDWIIREWGSRAIVEPGSRRRDQLRAAIQHLSRHVERRTIYTHTGWREVAGRRIYLSASGAIGQQNVEVELDHDLELYALPFEPLDPAGAMRLSLSYLDLAPARVVFPLWSAIWLAPLRDLVSVAFAIWVYGATGTLKSTLAALALNHYGKGFDDKHLPAGFTDTANRLEHKAFVVKDAPLIIDDFAPQKDQRSYAEYTRAAQRIVRGVGNLAGRGRLNADSTARATYVPRSLVIITGEDLPESESLVARLFVVELDRDDVDRPRLTRLQAQRARLSHAMAAYLAWLAENWAGLADTLPARWRQYRAQAFGDGLHLRLPEAVAGLACGLEMGARFAVQLGVLDGEAYQSLLSRGWDALSECAQAMLDRVREEKPDELFIRTFRELLAQGKIYLRDRQTNLPMGDPVDSAELVGWTDASYVYLLPEAAYTRIARCFRDQGNIFPVRELTLRKMLKEAGFLIERNGRLAVTEWIEGRSQRVLVLTRAILGEL